MVVKKHIFSKLPIILTLTKQSWKCRRSSDAPMRGSRLIARLTTDLMVGNAPRKHSGKNQQLIVQMCL